MDLKSKYLTVQSIDGKISAYEVAFRVYTKSNKIKWVQQLSKTISIDKEGKPRRIIEIYMDITAQLTINIDLEKKNKKLRELSSVASYYMQAYIRRN